MHCLLVTHRFRCASTSVIWVTFAVMRWNRPIGEGVERLITCDSQPMHRRMNVIPSRGCLSHPNRVHGMPGFEASEAVRCISPVNSRGEVHE